MPMFMFMFGLCFGAKFQKIQESAHLYKAKENRTYLLAFDNINSAHLSCSNLT